MAKRLLVINGVEQSVEIPKALEDPDRLDTFLAGGERFPAEAGYFAKLAAEHPLLGAERARRRRAYFEQLAQQRASLSKVDK